MKNEKVSTALLPIMKIQGMESYAKDLLEFESDSRRAAVLRCLIAAQERAHSSYQPIYGVALVACPRRDSSAYQLRMAGKASKLSAENSYLASFASVGARNQIWAGDIMRETLLEVENRLDSCVDHVRNEPFDKLVNMFESVSK